jgi:hypothetical protein
MPPSAGAGTAGSAATQGRDCIEAHVPIMSSLATADAARSWRDSAQRFAGGQYPTYRGMTHPEWRYPKNLSRAVSCDGRAECDVDGAGPLDPRSLAERAAR